MISEVNPGLAMVCACSSNILRLFVRSIAQVEVRPVVRNVGGGIRRTEGLVHAITYTASRRFSQHTQKWTTAGVAARVIEGEAKVHNEQTAEEIAGNTPKSTSIENAIADISLESLDSILAEGQHTEVYATPEISPSPPEETPQSLVADAFEQRRAYKARKKAKMDLKRAEKKIAEADQPHMKIVAARRARAIEQNENAALRRHATFPRLPRISDQATPTTQTQGAKPRTPPHQLVPSPRSKDSSSPPLVPWQAQKAAIAAKYPTGYAPSKRLSPDAITGIRALHAQLPAEYHTRKLAEEFQVSPEAISRILRTKWTPSAEEEADRARRWLKRGESVWERYATMGVKVPKRWRELGVGKEEGKEVVAKKRERRDAKESVVPDLVTRRAGMYNSGKKRRGSGDDGAGFI